MANDCALAAYALLRQTTPTVSDQAEASAMAETALSRLMSLGIELPAVPAPAASYLPSVRAGNLLFISGQVSALPGMKYVGKLGLDMDIAKGKEAARACAICLLANMLAALGDLEKVRRIVKLTGFVNVTPDFNDPHQVMNGCSDLLIEILGERGKHARSAVGMASLPLGYAVEVEAIVEVV
jgi:enamine deaminase RidA (YjgF/YER057c/UK114 family)